MELQLPDSAVELFAVHFNAPTSVWDIPRWRSDFERATAMLDQAGPRTVVAGDLNADWGHIRFRQLLAQARLQDAQDIGSVGFATTWPAHAHFPTLLRLDHVLLGQGMELNSFERLPPNSSDHLGLLAGLSLLKATP
jgi:endonuclease/exonuclease/phosphatase (EEP) superfamily protein YafD